MTTTASQFVGSIPENYDHGLGPHIFIGYAGDLAERVAGRAPRRVLELAAGTGIVTRHLRDRLPESTQIIASDLNLPMLEVARAKFPGDETVSFEQVDALDIPFEAADFDVVTCQFGVMFFPDKARSYAEVLRVLKPGGHYVFNVWDSWATNPFARVTHEAVEAFFPDDPPGFYKVPFSYHDPDEIRDAVAAAGFSDVKIQPVPLRSPIPSAARFAEGLVYGNPLLLEISERGGDPEAVRSAVEQAITAELGPEMPLQAIVVEATKP